MDATRYAPSFLDPARDRRIGPRTAAIAARTQMSKQNHSIYLRLLIADAISFSIEKRRDSRHVRLFLNE